MSVDEGISLILEGLQELREKDRKLELFGAKEHKYLLNNTLNLKEVETFEEQHRITLPEGYKQFILRVGNGGAGPYYGLESLEESLYVDLDYKREGEYVNPSVPFPHKEAWNMEFEGDEDDEGAYEEFQHEYFSEKWETGVLRICNYGCGLSLNLVVTGSEKGNIWVDDRGSDGGIYPDPYFEQAGRTTFLDWYLLWLEYSKQELKSEQIT